LAVYNTRIAELSQALITIILWPVALRKSEEAEREENAKRGMVKLF